MRRVSPIAPTLLLKFFGDMMLFGTERSNQCLSCSYSATAAFSNNLGEFPELAEFGVAGGAEGFGC